MTDSKQEPKSTKVCSYSTQHPDLEEENRLLKDTIGRLNNELERVKTPPLMVCDVVAIINDGVLIKIPNGNKFLVNTVPNIKLYAGDSVLTDQKNLNIIKKIEKNKNFDVNKFVIIEKPSINWSMVGGLKDQITEIHEIIELPLTKPELFKKVGITPPKGILLHGPPGTGKTLLAKAVAKSTNSTFIEVVGSELVQKYIGEGAKLIKEIFQLAREKSPAVVFIDEIDALAAKRLDIGTSGEREVERTFMQLLSELDGFKPLDNVKLIGCTNRKDILDPAIIRPGRLDRLIEVSLPDEDGIKEILKIHTSKMRFAKEFKSETIHEKLQGCSGAEIKAICTEAGYFTIRKNNTIVTEEDFFNAIDKVKKEEERNKDYLHMFG